MVVFDLDTAVDSYPEGLTASFPDLLEDNGHDARRFEGYKSRSSRRRRTTRKNVGNKGKKEEKSNLQIKGIVEKKQESPVVKSKKETPTDDTSRTGTGSSNGDMEVSQYVQYIKKESSGDSFTSEFTPSGEGSSCSEETTEAEVLLAKTQERMLYQRTVEENEELKSRIERKNEEIEVLAGQLRRATETKCDLVLLQSEMELHHEQDLDLKESEVRELEKANLDMQELRAEVEREFMNEITCLVNEIKETRIQHRHELDDWERLHRNEILEKEYQIAQLTQELVLLKAKKNGDKPKSRLLRSRRY